jgi:hypothetical protein
VLAKKTAALKRDIERVDFAMAHIGSIVACPAMGTLYGCGPLMPSTAAEITRVMTPPNFGNTETDGRSRGSA